MLELRSRSILKRSAGHTPRLLNSVFRLRSTYDGSWLRTSANQSRKLIFRWYSISVLRPSRPTSRETRTRCLGKPSGKNTFAKWAASRVFEGRPRPVVEHVYRHVGLV